jgi:hypothetical protein
MQVWDKGACLLSVHYAALHILILVIFTQDDLHMIHKVNYKITIHLEWRWLLLVQQHH